MSKRNEDLLVALITALWVLALYVVVSLVIPW